MSLLERFLRRSQEVSAMIFFQNSPPNLNSAILNIPKLNLPKTVAYTKNNIETTQFDG